MVLGTSPGTYIGLDLRTKLYLGGMDPDKKVPDDVEVKEGFYGCIAEVCIKYQYTWAGWGGEGGGVIRSKIMRERNYYPAHGM